MSNLENLIKAKELIQHCHFDDIKKINQRELIEIEINKLLIECEEDSNV